MMAPPPATPLLASGIKRVFHYAPLHYLPFILRSEHLFSKQELLRLGYQNSHFRRTSAAQDQKRGFAAFVHTTTSAQPPILKAKLRGGFPHIEIAVPTELVEDCDYLLCRFNIAKTRYFRGALQEPLESAENGRYVESLRLPVALTDQERRDLLRLNLGKRMVEVLVRDKLPLSKPVSLTVFSDWDAVIAREVAERLAVQVNIDCDRTLEYPTVSSLRKAVMTCLDLAVTDADWKGNGLDFDSV